MFIRKFGQEYHQICVTDSYQEVHDNYDKFDDQTGLHSAFAMEDFDGAVTKIGASNGTLIIEKTVLVASDLSVPANVSIDIRKGGSFAVSTTKTLTLLGAVNTNGQSFGSVFTGAGAVDMVTKGVFNEIYNSKTPFFGGSAQGIYEESVTQNFAIGTRRVMDDRVFRYCKAKAALVNLKGGAADVMPREGNSAAVEYAAGTFEITIPENPNGPDYALESVANYWADGYIWVMVAPMPGQMYRIKSSAAASGGFVTLTLYEALVVTVPASNWITAWVNPYSSVIRKTGKTSVICQPLISVTIDYYFWGQTWGPCFATLNGAAIGRTSQDRMVYYTSDGSLQAGITQTESSGGAHKQVAGFLITNTAPWTNASSGSELGGDQFYMLQLTP